MGVIELKYERNDLLGKQRTLIDTADRGKRQLTEGERKEYDARDRHIDELEKRILAEEADTERRRKIAEREARHTRIANEALRDVDPDEEFRGVGEMLFAIARQERDHVADPRLDALREKREQTMGQGSAGGYAVPERFLDELQRVQAATAVVRPRARVLTPSDPPDSPFHIPGLDQRAEKNWFGGVTLYHTGEGQTMTESTASLRELTLEPHEVTGYLVATNKLLANWASAGEVLTSLLTGAMIATADNDFISGSGIARPLGYLNSPACINIARDTAGQIKFTDVLNMASRLLRRGGSPCWVVSPTCIPQLGALVDAGSHSVWLGGGPQGGASAAMPGTLLGMPVVLSERVPALGTRGDLSLCDFEFYLVLPGSGPFIATSEHVYFTSNKTVFRLRTNVDGNSWLSEPLPMEGDPTVRLSPFVVLQ